jgi:hypothetical protein
VNVYKKDFFVLDLSGYSFSGKSAVYDLLTEFDGYFSHSKEFEFELIRVQGGLLDLRNALVDNWSPIRSSESIRNFYRLIDRIGGSGDTRSRFTSAGSNYDRIFPGFTDISKDYIESLIDASWYCDWPFPLYSCDLGSLLLKKIKKKLGFNSKELLYLSRPSNDFFISSTNLYLYRLFSSAIPGGNKCLVINNAFEPFYPEKSLELIESSKSIIVDRDPRDIYLSALDAGLIQGSEVGLAVTGQNVLNFIDRFKVYHLLSPISSPNVYRLSFESLVLDYEAESTRVLNFLGENLKVHSRKYSVFNPASSAKNVGIWKSLNNASLKSDIKIIERELSQYCQNI